MEDRFSPPFTVHNSDGAFWVEDRNGNRFAFTYFNDPPLVGTTNPATHSKRLAGRMTRWVARQAMAAAGEIGD